MKLAINWHSRLLEFVYHMIESTSNPRIKHLVRLRKSSRYRRERALFIVEGKREIEAFNAAGRNFEEIYFSPSLSHEISSSSILSTLLESVPSFELSEDAINKVSYRKHGSKFIGVAKTWDLKLRSPIDLNWKLVLLNSLLSHQI